MRRLFGFAIIAPAAFFSIAPSSAEELEVGFYDRPPLHAMTADGPTGSLVSLLNGVAQDAGLAPRYEHLPANRLARMIETDTRPICALGWFKTSARQAFAWFSEPLSRTLGSVVVARQDDAPRFLRHSTLAALFEQPDLRFVYDSSVSYGPKLDGMFAAAKSQKSTLIAEAERYYRLVATGRADFIVTAADFLPDDLAFLGLATLHFPDLPTGQDRHLMCARSVPKSVMDRLDEALARRRLRLTDAATTARLSRPAENAP